MSLHSWGRVELGSESRDKERPAGCSLIEKVWLNVVSACCSLSQFNYRLHCLGFWVLTNACSFITGPDRRHNCSIHATQILLLFYKVFIMNHSQIHFHEENHPVLRVLKSRHTFWDRKQKERKQTCRPCKFCCAVLPVDSNVLIYLVLTRRHPSRKRRQGRMCSRLWPHHQSHCSLRSNSTSPSLLSSTAPFLTALDTSHLLAGSNLEEVREEREGIKGAKRKLITRLTCRYLNITDEPLTSEIVPKRNSPHQCSCEVNVKRL